MCAIHGNSFIWSPSTYDSKQIGQGSSTVDEVTRCRLCAGFFVVGLVDVVLLVDFFFFDIFVFFVVGFFAIDFLATWFFVVDFLGRNFFINDLVADFLSGDFFGERCF